MDTDIVNEVPQPTGVFRADLGKTPANDSALREFNEYCDKLIAIGEATQADKIAFINEII